MSLFNEEILQSDREQEKVREMLQKSSIYVDINKIIDAYDMASKLEHDEIFSGKQVSLNDSRFIEIKKLIDSGSLQAEIDSLDKKVKTHKYILAKNREKDKDSLDDLKSKNNNFLNIVCYIGTKQEWNEIIKSSFPKSSSEHSIGHFVDMYKDLSATMERTCSRHMDDSKFAEKLNNMLEQDMASDNGNSEQGREDYQFALRYRGAFVKTLERNQDKYLKNLSQMSNESENIRWL